MFSRGEMERRLGLARAFMTGASLDALVLFGMRGYQAGVGWLTQYRDLHDCYLVVPRDGDPTLLVSFQNHLPNAREVSSVPTEWGRHRFPDEVAARLRSAKRVGLVGAEASSGIGMPYADHERLCVLLPRVELVDATAGFLGLQRVRSDEEIERVREAAALTDLALRVIVTEARPGVTEYELVAHAEHAYRLAGGEVSISSLRSMPMDAPTGCVPAQAVSGRELQAGDVILCGLSAMRDGYAGRVLWPVFVEAEPAGEWARLLAAGLDAYRALVGAVRHGATIADAVAAAEPIRAGGYAVRRDLVRGIGLDGPFQRGTTVVLQPSPVTRDERMGLQVGAAAVVRDDGAESLHTVPDGPLIAGSDR